MSYFLIDHTAIRSLLLIMNGPANNYFNNEALPLSKNIKLDNEPDNIGDMICIFLPHHRTGTNTSFEHQKDLVQLKEEPLDINGDVPKDPLAIEETDFFKSEDLKVENEEQKDLVQLKEEPLDVINDDIPKDPLAIEETNLVKSENLKVENDEESEISLNNEVSTPFNFNMKTNELQINDKHLHTVNTEEQIRFDPGHVTIDEEIIKGSTKKLNFEIK
ncbi:uncharacterized protein LOC142319829 [Lycorma delicatula]|uniref:uncharacterized protein LOC142319829 n=1 Tax=Lycorma delicatula TaxID=130591 RepID=UPI003F514BAC